MLDRYSPCPDELCLDVGAIRGSDEQQGVGHATCVTDTTPSLSAGGRSFLLGMRLYSIKLHLRTTHNVTNVLSIARAGRWQSISPFQATAGLGSGDGLSEEGNSSASMGERVLSESSRDGCFSSQ